MKSTTTESKFMSSAYQSYSLSIEDFSEKSQVKLNQLLNQFAAGMEAGSEELFNKIVSSVLEPVSGRSVFQVTMRDILDAEETVTQRDILSNRVFSVLAGEHGILSGYPIINPPIIGEYLDENGDTDYITVESGRHRISGITSLFSLCGFGEEDILDVEVPVFIINGDNKRIISANLSRGATQHEKGMVELSEAGINVHQVADIWTAYVNGAIPGTPVSQRSKAIRLSFILGTEEDKSGLTDETRGAVAVSLLSELKSQFKAAEYGAMIKDAGFLIRFLEFAASELSDAVDYARDHVGVTNMARAQKTLASIIVKRFKNKVSTGEMTIPVPTPKDTVTAVKQSQKTTNKRSSKKTVTEPQDDESDDVQDVVDESGEPVAATTIPLTEELLPEPIPTPVHEVAATPKKAARTRKVDKPVNTTV